MILLLSFEMKLPGATHAVVDIHKLHDYCLNPLHAQGRHKARVSASALQIIQTDAEFLRERLLDAVLEYDATPGETDEYGDRYIVDFECVKGERCATIRSGWMVRRGESFPRLTTCYVLSDKVCNG
jgi:hypothetical protein